MRVSAVGGDGWKETTVCYSSFSHGVCSGDVSNDKCSNLGLESVMIVFSHFLMVECRKRAEIPGVQVSMVMGGSDE